jgi:hypothetical protein
VRRALAGLAVVFAAAAFAAPAQAAGETAYVCRTGAGGIDSAFLYMKSGKVHAYASWYPAWAAGCPIKEVRIKIYRERWYGWEGIKEPYFPFFPVAQEAIYDCGTGDTYTYLERVTFVYRSGATDFNDLASRRMTCT